MAKAKVRYYKSLFVPGLLGQYKLWKDQVVHYSGRVDETIQLGNLISASDKIKDKGDFGPNLAILNFIKLWSSTYDGWKQLIGPNEIMALTHPEEWTSSKSLKILRDDWLVEDNRFFHTSCVNKKRLVTHGGLTYGQWLEIGKPKTADEASKLLNEKYDGILFPENNIKNNGIPNFSADPIMADPLLETYPSWISAPVSCPFNQIHTDGTINSPHAKELIGLEGSLLRFVNNVSNRNFGGFIEIKNCVFISVSPPIPNDRIVKKLDNPWSPVYIERLPVLDRRVGVFDFYEEREKRWIEGQNRYLEEKRNADINKDTYRIGE